MNGLACHAHYGPCCDFIGRCSTAGLSNIEVDSAASLSEGVSLLLMDTKVPRTLAASAYEERVNELQAICDIGQQAGIGRIRHLATLSEPDADALAQSVQSDVLKRRLRHVASSKRESFRLPAHSLTKITSVSVR